MTVTLASKLGTEDWQPATQAEVCLAFLRDEWDKVPQVTSWCNRSFIDSPDLNNLSENALRRLILASWREPLLQRIPGDTAWYRVRFLQDIHLDELLVIASAPWLDLARDRNELRNVAVRRPRVLGSRSTQWRPPILWSHDRCGPFSILEGNNRLIGYACASGSGPLRVECFVGLSPTACTWHLPDHRP